ncbi:MAG: hypothetical protein AB1Z98_20800 [Nannocystaceae bacterium]
MRIDSTAIVRGILRGLRYPLRGLLMVLFVYVCARTSEEVLRKDEREMVGGTQYYGAPYVYASLGPVEQDEDGVFSVDIIEPSVHWRNVAFFCAVGLIGALRLPPIPRPGTALRPLRLPLGATPIPEEVKTLEDPRLLWLAFNSAVCLLYVLAGSLHGYGMIVGPIGWIHASVVRGRYPRYGRRFTWLSTTARAMATAATLCGVGVYLGVALRLRG